ncbi:MAG: hypothetical protein WD490_06775 [Opitutales bacterium]
MARISLKILLSVGYNPDDPVIPSKKEPLLDAFDPVTEKCGKFCITTAPDPEFAQGASRNW